MHGRGRGSALAGWPARSELRLAREGRTARRAIKKMCYRMFSRLSHKWKYDHDSEGKTSRSDLVFTEPPFTNGRMPNNKGRTRGLASRSAVFCHAVGAHVLEYAFSKLAAAKMTPAPWPVVPWRSGGAATGSVQREPTGMQQNAARDFLWIVLVSV